MKIEMDANVVLGMTYFVGKDSSRCNLMGIFFEDNNIIATDGQVLARVRLGNYYKADIEKGDPFLLDVSKELLSFLKAHKKERVVITHNKGTVELSTPTTKFIGTVIDMSFPDWKKVIPEEEGTVGEIILNSELISRFEKFHKLTIPKTAPYLCFQFGEESLSPVKVTFKTIYGDDFLGIIMPARG